MKLLVTGGTGYIGRRLVSHALSQGHEMAVASRRKPVEDIKWIPFDLSVEKEITFPDGTDAVFHLATSSASAMPSNSYLELKATGQLIKAAKKVNARFIFVSSQTAREDAPTVYGRTKWQLERLVLAANGLVVRPGQVYGGAERALFGELVNTVRRLPALPAFIPAPMIQPVHIDDLIDSLLRCAELDNVTSAILSIGATEPISFTEFLRTIAEVRVSRYRLFIPLPVRIIAFSQSIFGKHIGAKFGLERLTSLFALPIMSTTHDLDLLGISLRPLSAGMTRSGDNRRRQLIREGQSFLTYVLKTKPAFALVRRYVRAIECMKKGTPLQLNKFMLHVPVAIALIDSPGQSTPFGMELAWRLNAAVVLAEASIQGAQRFLGIGESGGIINSLIRIVQAVALELCWRILRLIARPFLQQIIQGNNCHNGC